MNVAPCSNVSRMSWLLPLLAVVGVAAMAVGGSGLASGLGTTIYQKNSLYHRIFVSRSGSIVSLQFGSRAPDLIQSQVDVSNLRRQLHEYTVMTFAGLLYVPEPRRLLVMGLGGGVIPREMGHYYPEMEIDIAEIDPEVPHVAERFFGFHPTEKMRIHVVDGRVFIRRTRRQDPERKYDLIVLDAFNSDYIPFHLTTREFLEEVKAVLTDSGVVVANVFYTNRLFDAELATFLDVFPWCQVYFGRRSGNAILVAPASDKVSELTVEEAVERAEARQREREFTFDFARLVPPRLRPGTRPGARARVLTDDRAPVNVLRSQER